MRLSAGARLLLPLVALACLATAAGAERAGRPPFKTLFGSTFEHDTQAATGQTAGPW